MSRRAAAGWILLLIIFVGIGLLIYTYLKFGLLGLVLVCSQHWLSKLSEYIVRWGKR